MYVIAPADPIYHIALTDGLTMCGLWLSIDAEHRKRRDDWRLSETLPDKQFAGLCSKCDRMMSGTTKPEPPSLELLRPPKLINIIP
jgi:hypothetical protein